MIKKRYAILFAMFVAFATSSFADFGDIVRSWKAPWIEGAGGTFCKGLAWDGQYIWCNCDYTHKGDRIYRCRASNGSIISWFDSPFIIGRFGRGLNCRRWQGQPCLEITVWDDNEYKQYVYRLSYTGEIIGSFAVDLPGTGPDFISSLVFDGSSYWVTDPDSNESKVYKLNSSGSVLASFIVNRTGTANGICKQGDFLWLSLDDFSGDFYGACKIRPTGSIAASFGNSRFSQTTYDCAFDGRYLWFVTDNDMVYCFDVSNAPAVAPASIGKIKALYR
jgi:hypothetical protein